jgi:transposase
MFSMPKPFPLEFRRDVVAVARKGEAPLSQIAKDFGISESCLHRWLKLADVDDGVRPGVTSSESAELRELRKRNKTLEQENEAAGCHGRPGRRCTTTWSAGRSPRSNRISCG